MKRQQNIKTRRAKIEAQKLARANKDKYTPDQIDSGIRAYSSSEIVPDSLLAVARELKPQAFKAAEFLRNRKVLEYMQVCLADSEAHRILRDEAHLKNASLPVEFFGDNAEMVLPQIAHGDYPKAPKGTANGSALAVMAKSHIGAFESAVINLYGGNWEICELAHYRRACRFGDQAIKEETHGGDVFRMVVTDEEAKKIPSRMRKRRQRTEGDEHAKRVAGAYAIYPQEIGAIVYSHNPKMGEPIRELTQGYNREKLYQLTYKDCQTPEGKMISSSKGWGYDYRGTKGDGRKKNDPNYMPQSFTITTLVTKATTIEALGTTDGLNRITRKEFFTGLSKLEKDELIQPLKEKKFTQIVRFFDHWEEKYRQAENAEIAECHASSTKRNTKKPLSKKRDILEENPAKVAEMGLLSQRARANRDSTQRFETVVDWDKREKDRLIPFDTTFSAVQFSMVGATC